MPVLSGGSTSTAYRRRTQTPSERREVTQKRNISAGRRAPVRRTTTRKPATPAQPRYRQRSSSGSSGRGTRYNPPRSSQPTNRNRGSAPRAASSKAKSSGIVKRVTPPPKPPSLSKYLGSDDVYQQAVRGGRRSLADFLSELGRRRGESEVQFGQTKGQLEEDRVRQLERMKDEFAARGLIHSGLYGQEQGRFQEAFQKQLQMLEQQQAALLQDFIGQERDYRREQDMAMEVARQEALARRAAKYNIPL